MLYPLLWYENTSHLRGEYTGDLTTQSPNLTSREALEVLVLLHHYSLARILLHILLMHRCNFVPSACC